MPPSRDKSVALSREEVLSGRTRGKISPCPVKLSAGSVKVEAGRHKDMWSRPEVGAKLILRLGMNDGSWFQPPSE
ncbi:hypothetical protein Asi02nite_76350 [Asanoa siamensis]|uniref:Uncharacterized protein n=1 Tax=Asanoa siamensis TaxID=926357 RepID=A0ABQ4D3K3_9ACTN|nr:hypothetical protein Asi02nite_76350 [Asanoa siamensis]